MPILYKKNLPVGTWKFCIGTTHFHQYKKTSFSFLCTVGVPKTFGRPAGSFREPTFDPSKVGGGILDFPTGKSGFPGRESSWYKLLIGRGNPEIKVHLPIIPDFRNHYLEVALGCFHLKVSKSWKSRERTFISTIQLPFNRLYQEIMLRFLVKRWIHLLRSCPGKRCWHLLGPVGPKVDEPKVQGTRTVRFLLKGWCLYWTWIRCTNP